MHSTSLLQLLKEFLVQNPTFGFGLYLRPKVKNMASVILWNGTGRRKGIEKGVDETHRSAIVASVCMHN